MSSHLEVKWSEGELGTLPKAAADQQAADRLQTVVDGLGCVRESVSGKRPTVLFFFSELKETRGNNLRSVSTPGKTAKPPKEDYTAAAKRSLDVYAKVFGSTAEQRLRILTRFFRCVKMDITKIPAGLHPDVAEPKAPMVVIVDAQGKIAAILEQQRVDSRALVLGMYETLKKSGMKDVDDVCASMVKIMADMEKALIAKSKIQAQMDERKQALAEAQSKDQKRAASKSGSKDNGPSQTTVRAEQAVAQLQPALDAATKACEDLVKKDDELLSQAGVH